MKRTAISGGALVSVLVLLVLVGNYRGLEQDVDASAAGSRATTSSTALTEEGNQGFLYGRITPDDGAAYLGRLRFGRDEEAFWGDYFNGSKGDNPPAGVGASPAGWSTTSTKARPPRRSMRRRRASTTPFLSA